MKIIVDETVCEAHGECIFAAPELFDLGDDDETVTVLDDQPGEELHQKARDAEQVCPVGAIRLEE